MKTRILGAVSALAILVAATAWHEAKAAAGVNADASTSAAARMDEAKQDFKKGWESTKQVVNEKAAEISGAAQEKYEDIKARVIDEDAAATDVTINARTTAKGMLGQPVHNARNEKVGTLKDVILDAEGEAKLAVVSDGGFLGIGDKLAAFDYDMVTGQQANGDVLMPISDELIAQVAPFSYESSATDNVQTVPSGGYSVAELLKGKLVNPRGESLGDVENITFNGGEASQVIVAFDKKPGIGKERAALDFDDLNIAHAANGNLDLRMNANQSAKFDEYRKTRTN